MIVVRYRLATVTVWLLIAVVTVPLVVLLAVEGSTGDADARGGAHLLVLSVALLTTWFVLGTRGTLLQPEVLDDVLHIHIPLATASLALRRRVEVRLDSIESVRIGDFRQLRLGLKWPGFALPGVGLLGSFGFGKDRTLVLVRRTSRAVIVELRPGGEYARLVLEVEEPDRLVRLLQPVTAST